MQWGALVARKYSLRPLGNWVKERPCFSKAALNWIDRLRKHRAMRELVLDMDSSVSETYGERPKGLVAR